MTIEQEYSRLVSAFAERNGVESGQMFGKQCVKINGKAFLAQHLDAVVFKLTGIDHSAALSLSGARLWDPSGKGRPMKEWVAIPVAAKSEFKHLAEAAFRYVLG